MQVAGAADVEHLVVHVAEEVDAGTLRRAEGEAALAMHAARLRRSELDEVCDGARTAFLRHADQPEQDLRGRLGVGQRAMAGPRVGREAVRERGEIRRLASEQPPREPDRVDDRRCDSLAGQPHRLVVEERHVEARVVRDEHGVACEARKRRTAAATGGARRKLFVTQAGQGGDRRLQPQARGWRACSNRAVELEALARAPRRTRTVGPTPAAGRSSRGRRRRTSPPRGAAPRRARRQAPTRSPAQRSRASACTASSSSERASPTGTALPSFRTARAASSAATGPRRSSTSSTSRSAASRRSCTPRC